MRLLSFLIIGLFLVSFVSADTFFGMSEQQVEERLIEMNQTINSSTNETNITSESTPQPMSEEDVSLILISTIIGLFFFLAILGICWLTWKGGGGGRI